MKYLMMLVISLGLVACGGGSSSGGGDEDTTSKYTINNLERDETKLTAIDFKSDYYRANFVIFAISTQDATNDGTYTLALKQTSQPAPTAQEIKDSNTTITRKLSTTAINLYMPFHIDGTFFDASATQDITTIQDTILSPDTNYTLYILDDDDSVTSASSFKTDLADTTTAKRLYGMPPKKYTFTVKRGEPFISPIAINSTLAFIYEVDGIVEMEVIRGTYKDYRENGQEYQSLYNNEYFMMYYNALDDSLGSTFKYRCYDGASAIISNFKFEDNTTTP